MLIKKIIMILCCSYHELKTVLSHLAIQLHPKSFSRLCRGLVCFSLFFSKFERVLDRIMIRAAHLITSMLELIG